MADANKTEYDALIAKLEAHKASLTAAKTAADAITHDYDAATDKPAAVSKLRSDIAALDKLVKLTPGGASKRRRSGSKKQHKKKGGKSRRQHK